MISLMPQKSQPTTWHVCNPEKMGSVVDSLEPSQSLVPRVEVKQKPWPSDRIAPQKWWSNSEVFSALGHRYISIFELTVRPCYITRANMFFQYFKCIAWECLIYEMCLGFDATRTCLPIFVYVCHSAAPNSKLSKIVGMVCPYNQIQLGMVFD